MLTLCLVLIIQVHSCYPQTVANDSIADCEEEFDGLVKSMKCSTRAILLEPGEFVLLDDGTAYAEGYNKTYDKSAYIKIQQGKCIQVCQPDFKSRQTNTTDESGKYSEVMLYLSRIGLSISVVCLILHLAVFMAIDELRNLPGYNLAALSVSLLFGYSSYLVSDRVQSIYGLCVFVSCCIQFFLLSAFFWMSTMAFDVFRSLLKATGKLRLASNRFSLKRYSCYCAYSFGVPAVFVVSTLVLDNIEGIPKDYRPHVAVDICWIRKRTPLMILFGAPLIAVMCANLLFFTLSAYIIFHNRFKNEQLAYRNVLKRNCKLYFRLATIMGLTWIVGLVAAAVRTASWLYYLFLLLNTTNGLFIFLAFTCTSKVKKHIREKIRARARKFSAQSASPTFQSYWNSNMDNELVESDQTDVSEPKLKAVLSGQRLSVQIDEQNVNIVS